ncbi:MAG: DUF3380 domain-containing protein [Myxococcales bacterium]|nr:DUF3380 domain-containing protein [Myxococcales bacterium]
MKHEGPKGSQAQKRGVTQRPEAARGVRDPAMVGRRYQTGAALRSADHEGGVTGRDTVSSVAQAAADLHARHGETIRDGGQRAGVPESAVAAVVLAESDQVGAASEQVALRFEPYAFYQRTGQWVVATHKDQRAEYAAFEQARSVDPDAAHASVRVGLGQVAGSEAEAAGFDDPSAMLSAMQGDEAAQLEGLVTLIGSDDALCSALGSEDWAQVAELRAGPGYGAISYDQALASYAAAYQRTAGPAHGGDDDDDEKKKREAAAREAARRARGDSA